MKASTIWLTAGFLVLLVPSLGQAARGQDKALKHCAEAIAEHHPEVVGTKRLVKRLSGTQGRYEYWINVEGDSQSRIYCRASRREGVIGLAVSAGQWAKGDYPRPTDTDLQPAKVAARG